MKELFSVIGIDLALLNTGVALVSQQGCIELHKTIRIRSTQEETAKIQRLSAWVTQATEVFTAALQRTCHERGPAAPVFVVYESRPFLSGKQKQGCRSMQSVLSFGKSLALMRIALALALQEAGAIECLRVGAVPPQWWQIRLLGNGGPIGSGLLDEAEERLVRARTPGPERRKKALSLAAVYLRSGMWVDDDHQADAAGLAITVFDHLACYGLDT